jgi:2,4-dienoyl-CoA reductase-like NADH-dependent reductase (Old Yellow Enzyme family)
LDERFIHEFVPKSSHCILRKMSDGLFSPLRLRSIELRNRIAVSPMCQYSGVDGFATEWHFVHLGSRAVGGAAIVMVEATAVEQRGQISRADLGLWKDEHIEPLKRIAAFVKSAGAVPAIQLAHAGRKASTDKPWLGGRPMDIDHGGWRPVAPSPLSFTEKHNTPTELRQEQIHEIIEAFVASTQRAITAGFEILELHAAHGYLIHEFLSPLSNHRTDQYGGSFENRTRFAREVVESVRKVWPDRLPLFVRLSCTDWVDGGWSVEESVKLTRSLKTLGVDLLDCSSGGTSATAQIPLEPGYQVPFAERIRRETGIPTGAVGLITDAKQADDIIRNSRADVVLLAREFLRDPYWPIHAALSLAAELPQIPSQYARAYLK